VKPSLARSLFELSFPAWTRAQSQLEAQSSEAMGDNCFHRLGGVAFSPTGTGDQKTDFSACVIHVDFGEIASASAMSLP
jgi:hypothetical protein